MTQEQAEKLKSLIRKYGSVSENLGGIDGSYGWNTAYEKVEKAERELNEYIKSLIK